MLKEVKFTCTLALIAWASSTSAAEQNLIVYAPELSSYAAQRLVEECQAIAESDGRPIAIAVVNPAGELLHFHALQGASPTAPITAQLKAVTSARWRRTTSELQQDAINGSRGPEYLGDYPNGGGGVPIIMGEDTIGAIGTAGPGGPEDCALAAVRAVFGDTVSTSR